VARELPAKPSRRQVLIGMLAHAVRHSPYYRDQPWAAKLRNGETIAFADIPITSAALVRAEATRFHASFVPPTHGAIHTKYTSGSTGEPMPVPKTDAHFRINNLENQRLIRGWGIDKHRHSLIVLSPTENDPIGSVREDSTAGGFSTWTIYTVEGDAVYDMLRRTGATRINVFPSIILGALELAESRGELLGLKLITTMAEVVPEELRRQIARMPDCRLVDLYGSIETGLIAGQCPDCGAYHPAARHLILELLDETGRPAKAGALARIVVTPMFNRAMPLIRYETGDFALVGRSGACSRAPISIERIVGRERNLFKLPDGRRVTPTVPARVAREMGMRKFKLVQTSFTEIELRYLAEDGAQPVPQAVAQAAVDRYLSPGFVVWPVRVDDLPRTPGGKYLMHESLV
jgi:phenylacetate-CoA ligase